MSERTVRSIEPQIKIISAKDAEVEYVASDPTLDCYREILVPQGVDFSRFAKNAPFVDSHDYSTLERLLGTVTEFRADKTQVVERVKWAVGINPLADLGFKLTESGHLKAVSVGFMPGKMIWRDEPEFVEAVKELKLSTEVAAQCRCIHKTWQQIELSACIIGANPNALAKAFRESAIKEADLASIGFAGDAEFEFLNLCAAAYDGADEILRGMMRLELHRIFRARHLSPQSPPQTHRSPGGGGSAPRQGSPGEASMRDLLAAIQAVPRVVE